MYLLKVQHVLVEGTTWSNWLYTDKMLITSSYQLCCILLICYICRLNLYLLVSQFCVSFFYSMTIYIVRSSTLIYTAGKSYTKTRHISLFLKSSPRLTETYLSFFSNFVLHKILFHQKEKKICRTKTSSHQLWRETKTAILINIAF